MSKYINPKITEKLNFVVGNKATILAQTISRIFTAHPDDYWKDSGLLGFLCLIFDRSTKAPYIRVFETDTFELVFEMELYNNFAEYYKKINNFFYYFEVRGGFIGFSIQDEGDADLLRQKIANISPKHDGKVVKQPQKPEKPAKKKKGFLKGLYDKITGKSDSEEEIKISGPTDVKHESSIKFDFKKGTFDTKNIPSEWKTLFKKAGVEKKHLLDSEFAPLIMETLLNAYNDQEKSESNNPTNDNQAAANSGGGPPAPDLKIGGGPQAPALNMGGPQAPALNLGGPQAPALNLGGPQAPALNLGGPQAPALNLGGPQAPALNLGGPQAPALNLGGPQAPALNLGGPQAPAINLGGPQAPAINLGGPQAPAINLAGPQAPAINLGGPTAPSLNMKPSAPAVGNKNQSKTEKLPAGQADRGDLLAQIRSGNFQLNKIEKDEKKNTLAVDIKNMPKKVEESLTNTLAAAIAERRKQLIKNNYKEKETSDWSD